MLILVLPVTTILVALIGFYVWHRQLVRKRHFEVADAALSAFCQAAAAISRAREPTVNAGEGTTRKRGDYELPAYGGLLDRLYIPVERLKVHRGAFEELERAAVHVEVHFGSELAQQLREPLRAYRRIAVATACRMGNVGLSEEAKVSRALVRQWEAVVYAGTTTSDETDQLSAEMDQAKWALEAALRPLVEAPTFGEFLLVKKLLQSAAHRATKLVTRLSRPGYGKIAVYSAAPVSEPTTGDA
ncbi:hypothetical protein [Reyranella soli]|uniref:Uncharacterized protein n=1 Tax=Reyranella soli TaxID=1230389 RepID=A0A512NRY3_9HYPH|nr:hypothetical protein [Reyranella soli]GEP61705.1 hypothetical protein RSO01_88710 [Reyranella soli]